MIKSATCMYVVRDSTWTQIEKVWLHSYSLHSYKTYVVLARHIELLSIADFQIAKHEFLSSREHKAATSQQICQILATYLAQKFASVLYLRPSSQSPLAASLCSWNTPNMDFYSLKTWYQDQHSASFGELHSLDGSNVRPTKNGRPLLNRGCWHFH